MAGKLDRSLDEILKDRRSASGRPRRVTRSAKSAVVSVAPAGGVKKSNRVPKAPAKKATPTAPSSGGLGKIIVSNLPNDVTEGQIKDYFVQTLGPVRKVLLTYGPNGQSRGVATIIFPEAKVAAEAAKMLDGTKVDGRPMRVEVVLGAKDAPAPPQPKGLSERISQPKKAAKNAPKTAAPKAATQTKKKQPARERNAGRAKPKTTQELDAEMKDYFDTTANGADGNHANSGGAVQPVVNGGDAMDEIL